jgi:hypothetical protein
MHNVTDLKTTNFLMSGTSKNKISMQLTIIGIESIAGRILLLCANRPADRYWFLRVQSNIKFCCLTIISESWKKSNRMTQFFMLQHKPISNMQLWVGVR